MSNTLTKVHAVEYEGDWFLIPSSLIDIYFPLVELLSDDDLPNREIEEASFERHFGAYRTGGDLNSTQLYIDL